MIETSRCPPLFSDRTLFPAFVIDKLGAHPSDFPETFCKILGTGRMNHHRQAAGVLLTLLFRESTVVGKGEFVFQLIKRSSCVPQPGDLSFPGGMLHPVLDRLLRLFLIFYPSGILRGKARAYAHRPQSCSFRIITLFLANALRESWEEIRLFPNRVRFLGPLPSYRLTLFRRTIFPLAGFVEVPDMPRLSREVEKIVEIPLSAFFQNDHFGCIQIEAPDPSGRSSLQYPCLIHTDADGIEEVLWGATFHIIVGFLGILMDYRIPEWMNGRMVRKKLQIDYITGKPDSRTATEDLFLDRNHP
ncbi:MAG: hypothetical protein PHP66_05655 [Syntrophales bacterium]|nr:hypothetical protein [Syntrophales bacterium]